MRGPKGASPLRVPLVPAYSALHGREPDARPAARAPVMQSAGADLAAADGGHAGRERPASTSSGSVRLAVQPGDPATPADEADAAVVVNAVDVRRRSGLGDYTGELGLRLPLRITDRDNGGTRDHGPRHRAGHGARRARALHRHRQHVGRLDLRRSRPPSTRSCRARSKEGERAIWALDQLQVFDGGADGVAATSPNTLFAVQGIFVP